MKPSGKYKVLKQKVDGCHNCPMIQHVYDEQEDVYGVVCNNLIIKSDEIDDCYCGAWEVSIDVRNKIEEKYNGGCHENCPLDDVKEEDGFIV